MERRRNGLNLSKFNVEILMVHERNSIKFNKY